MSYEYLLEPSRRESRLGWWFMRTFRPKTVRVRTLRNNVIDAAYAVAFVPGDPVAHRKLVEALDDYAYVSGEGGAG